MTSVMQAQLQQKTANVPVFLMGHSMGGAQVLQYAARGPPEIRRQLHGYLAESPFVALHRDSQPARLTVLAGRLAAKVLPRQQLVQKLDPGAMSRDPRVCEEYAKDELCHDTGTLEGLAGMLRRGEELEKGEVVIEDGEGVRLWVGHGTGDKVCSFEATRGLMERLGVRDKEFRMYDGWFHKCRWLELTLLRGQRTKCLLVHAEPGDDKITFANEVADWILARVDRSTDQSSNSMESRSKL